MQCPLKGGAIFLDSINHADSQDDPNLYQATQRDLRQEAQLAPRAASTIPLL